MKYSIGRLGQLTNTKVPTIRYYEQIGLIMPTGRNEGGQRRYDDASEQRLSFIRHARELGFTLDAIRELLGLVDRPSESCEPVDDIVQQQLQDVERRLERLESIRKELNRMLTECKGGQAGDCRILEVLADHSLCLEADHGKVTRES